MEIYYGISLLVSHYKDKDAIINILTENVLLTVLFKGAFNLKNKKIIFTKPFIEGNFEVYKGKIGGYKFKDCQVVNYNDKLTNSINKIIPCDCLSEVILKTLDGIDLSGIFLKKTTSAFKDINDKNNEFLTLSNYLYFLIVELGIKPSKNTIASNFFSEYMYGSNDKNLVTNQDVIIELDYLFHNECIKYTTLEVNDIFKTISFLLIRYISNKFQIKLNCIELF